MATNSQRVEQVWVDYLRVVATFGVVLLHAAAPLLHRFAELTGSQWMAANVYDALSRCAVPVFFMMSGLLLLGRSEPLPDFFRKRVQKILLPLVFWSVFYVLWKAVCGSGLSFYAFYSAALTPAYYHLWFLYSILGVYASMPLLRAALSRGDRQLAPYFVCLWLVAASLLPIPGQLLGIESKLDLSFFSGFAGYAVLGFIAGSWRISGRGAAGLVVLCAACAAVTIFGTWYMTARDGRFFAYFYNYYAPNVVVFSCAVFVLARFAAEKWEAVFNGRMLHACRSLSSASFGIYLVHAFYLSLLERGVSGVRFDALSWHPAIGVPVLACVVFLLSYLTVQLLRMLPVSRVLVP